jgi:diguanylate cyclase (GGDEF)-like protein
LRQQRDAEVLEAEIARLEEALKVAQARIVELEAMAHQDPVTGLLNRRGFDRDLARAIAHQRRYGEGFALLLADLDGLKLINDTLGHPAGDAALRAAAQRLAEQVRVSDSVARLGGDEFAVILWRADEQQGRAKAATLREIGRGLPGLPSDMQPRLTFSIGVTEARTSDDATQLVARADADLYLDKNRRGRLTR